jgi:hypothetical protein
MYYDELIFKFKNKTKTTWKIIKKEIGNKCQNGIKSLKMNNTILNNPQEIANTFNDNLSTVADTVIKNVTKGNGDSKDNVDLSSYLITNFSNTFSRINWKSATTYEVNKIIKSLKTCMGYDEIAIKILKLSAPFIIPPLAYICNKSLSSGIFPERLKYAIIKPVYKKAGKLLTANYTVCLKSKCTDFPMDELEM